MNLLIDENMPWSLASELSALGFNAQDARDIGLLGHPDEEIFRTGAAMDAVIITRDLGGITFVEPQRALSQILRRRPKSSAKAQNNPNDQRDQNETLNAQLDET